MYVKFDYFKYLSNSTIHRTLFMYVKHYYFKYLSNSTIHRTLFMYVKHDYFKYLSNSTIHRTLLQLDRTPLHWACAKGHLTIAELLIDAGADLEAKDKVFQS